MMQLLNEEQTAKSLDVTKSALRRWRREKRGPRYIKVGRLIKYRESDLESWVEQNTQSTIQKKTNVTHFAS